MNATEQLVLAACTAGAVAFGAFGLVKVLVRDDDAKIRSRLENKPAVDDSPVVKKKADMSGLVQRIGQAAAQPFMPKQTDKLTGMRKKLAQAGVYSPAAVRAMTGFKFILLIGGVFFGWAIGSLLEQGFLGLSLGGLIGYVSPVIWLKTKVNANQKALTMGLPDALDLMVVCVEAGLTVDAAMQRVGEELVIAHPALSRELGIAQMQTRIGLPRVEALKNLGQRTGNPALQAFCAMICQAERFGTSIANALRIQAESLRNNRQMMAEEMAAKASVKMSFPLVLFIFPATFIVLAGPAVIQLLGSSVL
jgi:tight adherence protein C